MKKLLLLFSLGLLFMGAGKLKYPEDVYTKGDTIYVKEDDTLVNGEVTIDLKDGLTGEVEIVDGTVIKNVKILYPDGKIKRMERKDDNSIEIEEYFPDGKVLCKFKKDKKNGKITGTFYYKNGNISEKIDIKTEDDGRILSGEQIFYTLDGRVSLYTKDENGKRYAEIGEPDGEMEKYTLDMETMKKIGTYEKYDGGQLIEVKNYGKNGKLLGEQRVYNNGGELVEKSVIGKDGEEESSLSIDNFEESSEEINTHTGYQVIEKFADGSFKNTLLKNGQLIEEKEVIYDEYGMLKEEKEYKNNEEIEINREYHNGVLQKEYFYKDGEIQEAKIYFDDISSDNVEVSEGLNKIYNHEGKLAIEFFVKDLELFWEKTYYENGMLAALDLYKYNENGEIGSWRYSKDGKLYHESSEKKNSEDTIKRHIEYYPNGNLKIFSDGIAGGKNIKYYSDGTLKEEIVQLPDGKEKTTTYWKNGNISKVEIFDKKSKKYVFIGKYYGNGVLKSNGKNKYYSNGQIMRQDEVTPEKTTTRRFYSSGAVKEEYITFETGSKNIKYAEDGTVEYEESDSGDNKIACKYAQGGGYKEFEVNTVIKPIEGKDTKLYCTTKKYYNILGFVQEEVYFEDYEVVSTKYYNFFGEELE